MSLDEKDVLVIVLDAQLKTAKRRCARAEATAAFLCIGVLIYAIWRTW